ncbi:MAG: tetratricopeptide repeat protein [Methanobacteriota archaeon]|nr:MAG: tetratricopeptide repeat protein [Euryarchaeota archaeon]
MTQIVRKGDTESEERASELLTKANEAYDRGEYLLAIELLDDAITEGLSSVVALNNKGAALDALERREAAAHCYRSAISHSPTYELAWHNLGNCLMAQERYRQAAKAYLKAGRLAPNHVENMIGLAESLIELGSLRKARRAIKRISAAAEKDRSLLLVQADLYTKAHDGDSAIDCCKRYISSNPNDPLGYAHIGGIKHELGDYTEAIDYFEQALKLSPDDPQIWNNLGYTCHCSGLTDRALAAFDRAIEINPGYKHAWYNKGYALHGEDRLDEAVKCYEKALEIDPFDPILLNNLGNALYNLGKYADSLPSFVEAIDVDPDYEIAWNNIGNALEKMGQCEDAIPFHDRSLEIRPDFDYAFYAKGICKIALGDVDEGYELLLESLDLNPTYDEAWKARALAAQKLGRMDDAIASIENALVINPMLCDAWIELGNMLTVLEDGAGAHVSFERALECVEEMSSRMPLDGDPWRIRAAVLSRLGRYPEALDSAVKAVSSRHPDMSALPLAFDICRLSNISVLPSALADAADMQKDIDIVLPYALFLARIGNWPAAARKLSVFQLEELTRAGRSALVRAIAADDRKKALSVAARCPESERGRLVAEVEYSSGNWRDAIDLYQTVLDENPSDYRAALGLADALLRQERFVEAVETASIAAGVAVDDWEPFDIMAEAYDRMENEKRAAEMRARVEELKARCTTSAYNEWIRGDANG